MWPSTSTVYALSPGDARSFALTCPSSANICYGAQSVDGRSYWGVDIDNSRPCQNCCVSCANVRRDLGSLSCGTSTSPPPTTIRLPQPSCVPNGGSGTNVSIVNNTSYAVTLNFSGPTSRSVSLAPAGQQSFSVSAGSYAVTGQTSSPNVVFQSSTWSLSTGCNYPLQVVFVS